MLVSDHALVGKKQGSPRTTSHRDARVRAVIESLEIRSLLSSAIAGVIANPSSTTGLSEEIVRTAASTLPAPAAVGQGSTTAPGPQLDSAAATFQWDAVTPFTGFTGYQVNAYDETAKTSYTFKVGTSVTSDTAPSSDLTPGDDYVWNVRVIDGTTTGPESAYLNFVVPPAATLPAPVATGPGSTAKPGPVLTTSAPTLSWQAVTGVTGLTGYQIYLTDLTASKTYSYQTGVSVDSYAVPAGTLAAGDTFVWDVRILVGTQSGPPSSYLYFQTPAAVTTLPAPAAVGQGSTATPYPTLDPSAATFQWDAVTGVSGFTGYQINLYNQTTSTSSSYTVGASVTSYSAPSSVLTPGDTFVWNVRILDGNTSGPPSAYLSFVVPAAAALPAPIATGPGSTVKPGPVLTTSAPTLSWQAVTGVTNLTGYQIYLTDETASKTYSYQTGASVDSYAVPAGTLAAGDTFVWDVRVIAGTQDGPPSTYLYFQTLAAVTVTLPAPVAVGQGSTAAPGPTLDTSSPVFQWDAITGVSSLSGYQINLYNQTTSTSYSYKVGTSLTSYSPPSGVLLPGDTYVWNVRALAGTQSGPPSTYLYFQMPAAATLPAPVATGPGSTEKPGPDLTTSAPTLSWQAVTGVTSLTGYQIYLTDETAGKTYSYQTGASVDSFTVPTGTLASGDTFVWDVRVIAGTQDGPPSSYLYFQTPAAVTVTLPAPVATGQGSTTTPYPTLDTSSPTFAWSAVANVSGLTGYQINLYNLTAAKGYSYQVGTSVTSYTAPSSVIVAGDDYVWNVRVLDGNQSGPPSNYLYFQAPGGTGSANPPTVGTVIAAATAKLTHVEALQHKVVKSLKTASPGTTTYSELKQQYDAWEKRIKELKIARADLESEI
jgi:hypothetical protein